MLVPYFTARRRRKLLDQLHAHDGQTLGQLCEHLNMTRQGVTQQHC